MSQGFSVSVQSRCSTTSPALLFRYQHFRGLLAPVQVWMHCHVPSCSGRDVLECSLPLHLDVDVLELAHLAEKQLDLDSILYPAINIQ